MINHCIQELSMSEDSRWPNRLTIELCEMVRGIKY